MFVKKAILVVAMLAVPAVLLAADDPYAATWKLNVAKSKYNPGPAPQSSVTTYEITPEGGLKVMNNSVDAHGKAGGFTRVEMLDGKHHPVEGNPVSDSMSAKRIDRKTIEVLTYKNGQVTSTLTRRISKDGKTMTATAKGTNARGEHFEEVRVFDKQ